MSKHTATATVTAKAPANLLVQSLETLDDLISAPVGAIIEDAQGDTYERLPLGAWRGNALPYPVTDEGLVPFLPAKLVNHGALAGLELEGYRLGDLVRVTTSDYAAAVAAGSAGVVERIVGPYLYLRFRGGVVCPLLPAEVEPIGRSGVTLHARVEVTSSSFAHGPLGEKARGVVIGRAPGYIEPSWIVRIQGDSPWLSRVAGWIYPESSLRVIERTA